MTERLDPADAIAQMLDGEGRWARRRWVPILFGAIMFFDSWDIIVIAFILPILTQQWGLDALSIGWLLSSAYIGQFFGALTMGVMAERYGRKPVFCIAVFAMCVFGIACALANGPGQLQTFRFLQGIAMGGALPVAVSYVNEVAPVKTRGRFFSTYQFLMVGGFVAASASSALLAESHGWRLLFLIGATPVVLLPLLWFFFPESPRWLCRVRGFGAAAQAVARLGGPSEAPGPIDESPRSAERVPASALFRPSLRGVSIVIFLLWFLTSLVNYGLVSWTPTIFVSEFGLSISDALRLGAIGSIPIFLAPLVLGQTIDRFGRRPFAIGGALLAAMCLATLAVMPYSTPMVLAVLTLGGGFATGVVAIILWPYSSEVFPTPVRAVGLGVASSLARAASSLTPLLVGGVIATSGSVRAVFAIFAVIAAVTVVIWWRWTRETARQPMVEHV